MIAYLDQASNKPVFEQTQLMKINCLNKVTNTGVFNDPLGKTNNTASSNYFSYLKMVLF